MRRTRTSSRNFGKDRFLPIIEAVKKEKLSSLIFIHKGYQSLTQSGDDVFSMGQLAYDGQSVIFALRMTRTSIFVIETCSLLKWWKVLFLDNFTW